MKHNQFTWRWVCVTLVLITLLAGLPAQHTSAQSLSYVYYPQYGHFLGGTFRVFWESNGGVDRFGYPITEEYVRDSDERVVQYFERARFELGFIGSRPIVELGWVGQEFVREQGYDFEPIPPFVDTPTDRYFPETGHSLRGGFKNFWDRNNGAAMFGAPLSEEFIEILGSGQPHTIQYFERARFELHGDRIKLGLLGLSLAPCQQLPARPANQPPSGPLPEGSDDECGDFRPDLVAFARVYPDVAQPGTVMGFEANNYFANEVVSLWLNLPDGTVRSLPYRAVANSDGRILIGFLTEQGDPEGQWSMVGQGVSSKRVGVALFRLQR